MASRYKSARSFPKLNDVPNGPVLDFLTNLMKSLQDLESDVPNLPVNKTKFNITTTTENYALGNASTLPQVISLLGTLLTKLRDAGIIT